MKRENQSRLVTLAIFIIIGIIVAMSLTSKGPFLTDVEVAQCIGEKATLYVQLGCTHCKTQEEMFGENLEYLNIIDCFYGGEGCDEIKATPTWKIGNKYSTGVQSIEMLRTLTGC
jgi:hypothetical protein